jgi:hypothetical protein
LRVSSIGWSEAGWLVSARQAAKMRLGGSSLTVLSAMLGCALASARLGKSESPTPAATRPCLPLALAFERFAGDADIEFVGPPLESSLPTA